MAKNTELDKLLAERENLTTERLQALYKEHKESPYVKRLLREAVFNRMYRRFLSVEINAWVALENGNEDAYFKWDRESQRLCAMLGY